MRYLLAALAALFLVSHSGPARAAEPLVDAAWLAGNLDTPDLVVLDIRNKLGEGSEATYRAGHVPGAVYSDYLKAGWRTKVDGVPGQLAPIAGLETLIGGLGIDNASHVVIVAGGVSALDMASATRVYWTFKVLGHDEVSILDGGWRGWSNDAGRPRETGSVTPEPGLFTASFRAQMVAGRDDVLAAIEAGTPLIDHRPPGQYAGAGKHPAAKRPGTITGAVSIPEGELTVNGGTFADTERVAGLLAAAGLDADGEKIAFCNTGHWASLGWFAMSELLGNKGVRVYDGSMVDWSADPALPMSVSTAAQ